MGWVPTALALIGVSVADVLAARHSDPVWRRRLLFGAGGLAAISVLLWGMWGSGGNEAWAFVLACVVPARARTPRRVRRRSRRAAGHLDTTRDAGRGADARRIGVGADAARLGAAGGVVHRDHRVAALHAGPAARPGPANAAPARPGGRGRRDRACAPGRRPPRRRAPAADDARPHPRRVRPDRGRGRGPRGGDASCARSSATCGCRSSTTSVRARRSSGWSSASSRWPAARSSSSARTRRVRRRTWSWPSSGWRRRP